ncbi:chromosome transmission fidelity protein 18 homolog isoform X2 [Latimeria chalumnae]|uniref:chromosome transmission fidelity protein 18 homolog isoform X2 n=1 Tax=Latimeria chalumnae TaxID=7897 RepID=UPI00313E4281
MEDYEDLYGIEDDFERQFADELEVLAELEDDSPPCIPETFAFRKIKRCFEEELAAGDAARNVTSVKDKVLLETNSKNLDKSLEHAEKCKKRNMEDALLHLSDEEELQGQTVHPELLITPKHKRPRLEAVRKLDFNLENNSAASALPSDEITPPSSPEDYSTSRNSRTRIQFNQDTHEVSDMAPLQLTPTESQRKHVLKRPPVLEDYLNVTATDGTRVFMVLKDDQTGAGLKQPELGVGWTGQRQLHLLGVPFSYLKEQVAEERRQQVLEESRRLSELLNNQINQEFGEPENEDEAANEVEEDEDENEDLSTCTLWVDKFTPKHYTELLSDDYTNRCLLKWLKLWDTVVFGKERTAKKIKSNKENRPTFKQQKEQQNKWKSKAQITEEILESELDQHNRPKYKVALLSGPPGLGKTTLAHVIAKHAGYNVVEMNASDDRSPELFKTQIEAATQMKSVLGVNEKPNCLIIDEIDGAPAAAINVLLNIVNRKDGKDEESGPGAGKKKKKEGGLLVRPLICICNDLYVPALRQLRQQAFTLSFPVTLPSRLVQRLHEISIKQGMKADTGALLALCEKTENDIRSCVNTLQFLHGRGSKELNMRMVQTMKIGLKDQNKGLFAVWQEIFHLPKLQRKRIGQDPTLPSLFLFGEDDNLLNPVGTAPVTASAQRFLNILHVVTSAGEYEKLTQGLYDNFLNMKFKDPNFGTVCLALEWLEFSDILNEYIMHGQNFQLMRYLPFLPVTFHMLFAASSVPRIAYPSSQYEAQTKLNQMHNLVTSMMSETTCSIRSHICPQTLVMELLCLLLEIISPKLRPVNTQLYSQKEKQQLADLIGVMLSYNLTYQQERTLEGQYIYKLDPNVEDVCRFPELPIRKQMTYQAKQLIAREIELEKMRRTEALLQARNANRVESDKTAAKSSQTKGMPKPSVKNHEMRLESIVKTTAVEEKPELDFFGRQVVKKEKRLVSPAAVGTELQNPSSETQIGKAVGNSDVWFRFNEGFSNAVRRNVYIKDLF